MYGTVQLLAHNKGWLEQCCNYHEIKHNLQHCYTYLYIKL